MKYDKNKNRTLSDLSDRANARLHRELTPVEIQDILDRADSGDPADLCRLAVDLEERNWEIRHCAGTRRNALLGCPWKVVPGGEGAKAAEAAEKFEEALKQAGTKNGYDTFQDLLSDLSGAIVAPYAVSEILWDGSEIAGFRGIEGRHFTFLHSREPRLILETEPEGMELPPGKFIFHWIHRTGNEIGRGGLVRTLAWLHCFQSYPLKDFLAYSERFGMPFLVAKLDRASYDRDRDAVRNAIRNFGARGGGVFSKSMEIELLQAASGGGDVYRNIISYMGEAITKVILGQLASSDKASGLSGGDVQSRVRQDILEADARKMETTLRAQLAVPWTSFHYEAGTPVPVLQFQVTPPEDLSAFAQTLKELHGAGLDADPEEIGKRFGLHLERKEDNV